MRSNILVSGGTIGTAVTEVHPGCKHYNNIVREAHPSGETGGLTSGVKIK